MSYEEYSMKKIIISPYSSRIPKVTEEWKNPKDYPWWDELVKLLKKDDFYIIQVGISGEKHINGCDEFIFNKSFRELLSVLNKCDFFISVDNFFHHFAHYYGKWGIVIFGVSDPTLFGYKEHVNLLKSRKNLRQRQFGTWNEISYNESVFVSPEELYKEVKKFSADLYS